MGFLLNILSELLKWLVAPIFYIYGCIASARKGEFDNYNKQLALAKDQYGNVLLQYALNKYCIKPHGYKFGNRKETMSSAFGKNELAGTYTNFGKQIIDDLNDIEANHCKNSIDTIV
jgi:hypothetical protein